MSAGQDNAGVAELILNDLEVPPALCARLAAPCRRSWSRIDGRSYRSEGSRNLLVR